MPGSGIDKVIAGVIWPYLVYRVFRKRLEIQKKRESCLETISEKWGNLEKTIPPWEGTCPRCGGKDTIVRAVWNPRIPAKMREYGCLKCDWVWGKELKRPW
jgi:hypothetical protein